MSDPIATANDVRSRLNLPDKTESLDAAQSGISDDEIDTYLEDAAFDIDRAASGSMDDALRKQLEWRLAGIKILGTRKGLRSYHQQSLGSMSRSYETHTLDELKEWVKRNGPSGLVEDDEFWHVSLQG